MDAVRGAGNDGSPRAGGPDYDRELAGLLRSDAATGVPAGRCVQMLLHRQLDEAARAVLVRDLGARFDGDTTTGDGGALLGADVRVVVTERRPYCWLVSAHWPEDVPARTPAARVRAAFRSVLTALR